MRLGRVFISSVFGGMLDLRDIAALAARLVGLEPVLTEHHVAQASSVRDALTREIEACDTYVGLFNVRRGTIPPAGTRDHRGLNEFLNNEVSEYTSGVWARPYDNEAALRREIAAGLSALRPRVVLALSPGAEGLEARLFLRDVASVWNKETVLGPVPVDFPGNGALSAVTAAFRSDIKLRSRLPEAEVQGAGLELAAFAFPGPLGDAVQEVLDAARHVGRLVPLEIRTSLPLALALPWELISFSRHPLPVRQGLIEIVRRIPGPGESLDPALDPAPTVPADHLAVLGFTPDPLEDQAPSAADGSGDSVLFWEQEQERLLLAFESLLREQQGRLALPDTGEKDALRELLLKPDRPQVVHLACHGGVAHLGPEPEPALFLEDAGGRAVVFGQKGTGALAGQEHAVDPLRLESCCIGIAPLVDAIPDVLFDSPAALSKAMSGQLPENLPFVNRVMYVVKEQVGEMVADGSRVEG